MPCLTLPILFHSLALLPYLIIFPICSGNYLHISKYYITYSSILNIMHWLVLMIKMRLYSSIVSSLSPLSFQYSFFTIFSWIKYIHTHTQYHECEIFFVAEQDIILLLYVFSCIVSSHPPSTPWVSISSLPHFFISLLPSSFFDI